MGLLKPFVINLNDIAYLLAQVNFVPIFDAPTNGNGIVSFDPMTMDAWDANGNKAWDHTSQTGSYAGVDLSSANVSLLGSGFPQVSAPIGIRDVTGYHNNLFGTQADWGTVDVPFVRQISADYTNYVTTPGADYTPDHNVTDYMPRIISRTITTGGVNLLQDTSGHFVEWSAAQHGSDPDYRALVDASGVDTSKLVEGTKIVAPLNTEVAVLDAHGDPLIWSQSAYQGSMLYTVTLAGFANTSFGGLFGSASGGALVEGGPIYYQPVIGTYIQLQGQTYQPDLLAYKPLVDSSGVPFSSLVEGEAISTTVSQSGYGLLEQIGHIDFQNPTSGEYFIGSENPGVAPVNAWFGIFGQFFDHGLDFIGKGGAGTITIALDPSDPLYGTIGSNGQPVTSITVSRATPSGTDANGDAAYPNHTSPFIDQSQTYGSADQNTSILRQWVSTDNGQTFHAGMNLFDGTTLEETWTRRWPDGTTSEVNDTLPTLNELRAHLAATDRDNLTWEDVSNLRNRDLATGDVIADDQLGAGNSGHALLLDMNPHFDGAHITQGAIDALNLAFGTEHTSTNFSVMAILPYVNGDFSIKSTLSQTEHDAVSEILMESVGDHYVAGDGRVNENFGLTAIHHVFHEEHNYQVENLKSWIYAHDTNNPGATDPHEQLHNWQINTGNGQDAAGNYLTADNSIAWDPDKMFNATKLIVEMEYQHAAVDQYARTVTPRIQEFVGYSTGVDSTISLEYSQVAFRFGHSTIRETIDTLDPSGWYKGAVMHFALEKAFLAPQTFAAEGAAAITLGLTQQQMNEIDEFVTPALNQGLLDQPLDLAAINIARGRDLGIPTLNDFRAGIGLAEYTSWADYGSNMIHPESLVNFIAAYSFGGDVAKAQYVLDLADGAAPGTSPFSGAITAADAIAFLNNNDGSNAELNAARLGFDKIDSWIGGLAEAHVPGGLLGETFDAVFVAQIQALMDGDRFYYLYRLFGTQIHEEVNNGQFKDIVERNTGLSHLNGSIFAYADKYYDFTQDSDPSTQAIESNHAEHGYADLIASLQRGIYSDGGTSTAANGSTITVNGVDYIRDVRPDLHPDLVHPVEGTPTDGADSHEVIVGTQYQDFIHARSGDDTVYGDGGDDTIYGDGGVDRLYGGDGNDLIDTGEGPDLADGGAGKDTIYGRGSGSEVGGFDQLVGGSGNDLIVGGEGIDKLSGGSGDDIMYGDGLTNPEMGNTEPFTHGGDGNDYIDGGASGDVLYGEEGDDYVIGGNDQDLISGGQGDDILRPGNPSQAINGGPDEVLGDDGYTNNGFDLIDFSDYVAAGTGVTADLSTQTNPLVAIDGTTPFPAWFQIEGVIGSQNADTLSGDSTGDATADLSLGKNWLIGGSGNDVLQGNGGNDLLIGGSIRLDTLIGKYADADNASGPGNLKLGSAEWLADAMRTGSSGFAGANDGYDNDLENSYTGSSNQATGTLSGGLLAGAGFDKHFTEMLRSRMFKDVVLGDGGTDGTADKAVFVGNLADYSMVALDVNGQVVANPHLNWASVLAIKITDNVGDRPQPDGTVIAGDGTDLVVGVEKFQFADQTINPAAYFDIAPTLDLHYAVGPQTVRDTFGTSNSSSYSRNDGSVNWNGNWQENGDINSTNNGAGGGAIRLFDTDPSNNESWILQFQREPGAGGDGASISRGVDLSGATTTTAGAPNAHRPLLTFDLAKTGIGTGETLQVQYSSNGTTWTTLATYGDGTSSTSNSIGAQTIDLSAQALSANSAIRFVVSQLGANGDYFRVDNVQIAFNADTDGINYSTSYTEQLTPAPVALTPRITDPDDTTIVSAKIVIRDPVAGDRLNIGSLPGGITATGNGTTTITLTGTTATTFANFQTTLAAITFSNPTNENPTNNSRHIDVTVNDGLKDSAVATTTVQVNAVDDPAILAIDSVITNVGLNTNFAIPDFALLANDSDVDSTMTISGISNGNGIQTSGNGTGHNNETVTVRDTTGDANTFQYSVTAPGTDPSATVTVAQQTGSNLNGTASGEILVDSNSGTAHTINGNGGNDFVFGNGGDDTIVTGSGNDYIDGGSGADSMTGGGGNDIYVIDDTSGTRDVVQEDENGGIDTIIGGLSLNLNDAVFANVENATLTGNGNSGLTGNTGNNVLTGNSGNNTITWNALGGRDAVDGGGGTTDTFVVNGNASAETFDIYAMTNGQNSNLGASLGTTFKANTEIVITRTVGGVTTVAAELDNIDEITINTLNVTANNNGGLDGGVTSGDTVVIHGDFTNTDLNYSTITINGDGGDNTVDITGLTSDHRIVFHGGDGNNHVVGTLRPQDVVDNLTGPSGSGGDSGSPGGEQNGSDDQSQGGASGSGDDQHCSSEDHDDQNGQGGAGTPIQPADIPALPAPHIGTPGDDVMIGASGENVLSGLDGDDLILGNDGGDTLKAGSGDDLVKAGAGDDVVFGNDGNDDLFGGSGKDLMTGDAGDDRLFGDAGDDALEGGTGNDTVYGGASNDRIITTVGDGDDTYFGDTEEDTLDYSAIAANITADLGNGIGQHGSVTSAQSGTDKVFGFEDFIGGSGNDTIVASSAANVMDGGGGNDTFVFGSAGDADGDTIKGFQPGDKIDLSAIDANTGASGTQSFVLFAGNVFTSAGQVIVTHEVRDGAEHTIVSGNTNNDAVADFKIDVAGNHALTSADFNGVH